MSDAPTPVGEDRPHDERLPEELIARTAALLVRGGAQALGAFAVLVGAAVAVILFGTLGLDLLGRSNAPGAAIPFSLAIVLGVAALPVTALAAPFAAFDAAALGRPTLYSTLGRAIVAARYLIGPAYLELIAVVPLGFGGTLLVAFVVHPEVTPLPVAIFFATLGVVTLIMAVWIHGLMLVRYASLAFERNWWDLIGRRAHCEAVAAGLIPFGAAAALGGGVILQRAGLVVLPGTFFEVLGVVATVVGVSVAHVVSCAAGVAIASRVERTH